MRRHIAQPLRRQRGVALISVLLIFAIAAALAVRMMSQGSLQTKEVATYLQQQQLRTFGRSAESYAVSLLRSDWLQDTKESGTAYDHPSETWAKAYYFSLDQMESGGWMSESGLADNIEQNAIRLRIEALDGRFNLNNLFSEQSNQIEPQLYHALQHLLVQKQIPEVIADLFVDWIDNDSDPVSLLGAEDNQYLLLQPPYRSANQPVHNLSEVFLLHQIEPKSLPDLSGVLVALPQYSRYNLNIIIPEVMAALMQTGSEQAAHWLIEREQRPISDVTEFLNRHQLKPEFAKFFSTQSQYFQVVIKIEFESQSLYLRSLVYRNLETGMLKVLTRNFQPFADSLLNDEQIEK